MLDFVISNYIIFVVISIILLLGLIGYIMDRKKYEQYKKEILNESRIDDVMQNQPDIQTVAPITNEKEKKSKK